MKIKLFTYLHLLLGINTLIIAQNYGNWKDVDAMKYMRRDHASIILPNRNVLITGGTNAGKSCEIFNTESKKWEYGPVFNYSRSNHNLVQLHDGRIIAIGGFKENTSEILALDNSKWIITDTFAVKRFYGQSSIVLDNSNVLLIGGLTDYPITKNLTVLNDCQIFDVAKMRWRTTGKLNIPRYFHTTTKLTDGRILVTGGDKPNGGYTNTCEIYDPQTERWTLTDTMEETRSQHAAILLNNGNVLVFGGYAGTIELFDYVTEKWTIVGYASAAYASAVTIGNGEFILYIGGPTKYSCGWGIISLKEYSNKYFKLFGEWVYAQSITKIDEYKILIAGGVEVKDEGSFYVFVNKAKLFDYNLTDIEKLNTRKLFSNDLMIGAFPNPFNPITKISFSLKDNGKISLKVFDVLGKEVANLADGYYEAGKHAATFNGSNLASGIYFYRLTTPTATITKKMNLIK